MIGTVRKTIDAIKSRRQIILDGGINSIPSPLKRFSSQYVGVERGTYYLITSGTKGAKTQLACYLFVFEPILYAFTHRDVDIKIFYFPLEETKERIAARFISFLLYKHKGIRVPYKELMSVGNEPISGDILSMIGDGIIAEQLKFFDEHVVFIEGERNPTGVFNTMKKYAEANGTIEYKEYEVEDEFGIPQKKKLFDGYKPNNPNSYTLFIVDHVSLIDTERGYTKKQAIDKLSEYCVELVNRYQFSPVIIQQQVFNESADNQKADLLRPTLTGCSDSKYPSRDAHISLGLFAPHRYRVKSHIGYDITRLRDNYRCLEVLANRNGETGAMIGLYFDGAVGSFEELPRSSFTDKVEEYYKKSESNRITNKQQPQIEF